MTKTLQRILCIDDEKDILDVATMCLETVGGFDVYTSEGSEFAVERAIEVKPDLILLDVMMPGMDGPTTFRFFQGEPTLTSVPVVFMTARVQPAEVEQYLDLGAAGVVSKPFDPMNLSDQITEIWEKYNDK